MCEARGKREYFRNNFNLGRAPAEEGRGSSVSEGSRGEGEKVGKGSVWQLCEIMPMSQSSSTIFGGITKHQVTMLKDRGFCGVFARQYYRQKPLKLSYCWTLLCCCQETRETTFCFCLSFAYPHPSQPTPQTSPIFDIGFVFPHSRQEEILLLFSREKSLRPKLGKWGVGVGRRAVSKV